MNDNRQNRNRIISWLFPKRYRDNRTATVPEVKPVKELTPQRPKSPRRIKKGKEKEVEKAETIEVKPVLDDKIEESEIIDDVKEEPVIDTPIITPLSDQPIKPIKPQPSLYVDEKFIEEIKTQNEKGQKEPPVEEPIEEEKETREEISVDEELSPVEREEEIENYETSELFPKTEEIEELDETELTNVDGLELIELAIIEEIDTILNNDLEELNDIKYQLDVLSEHEEDEVLLENVEKIERELKEVVARFEEVKKKYEHLYKKADLKITEKVNTTGMSNTIATYMDEVKNGLLANNPFKQIDTIEEFITIINNIIEIERQKEIVNKSINNKLIDYDIRDEEFIKLQERYANISKINESIEKYNIEVNNIINDLNTKINNSVDVSKRIEIINSIVPDVNQMMKATILLSSSEMIPPTPIGFLFKASLFVTAAHMMAEAFTPKEEQKEIKTIKVKDYTNDINVNKSNLKTTLNDIDIAFTELNLMKDTFEKEFNKYKNKIPEYDTLLQNVLRMEKELTRQQNIIYDYNNKFDEALDLNNEKVKILENE